MKNTKFVKWSTTHEGQTYWHIGVIDEKMNSPVELSQRVYAGKEFNPKKQNLLMALADLVYLVKDSQGHYQIDPDHSEDDLK